MNIAVPIPPITPQIPLTERTEAAFVGDPVGFFRLLRRGSVLQIPTAGFYRFWLVTDIRRHLWGNTRIGRETLEYTGTGRELVIGFMRSPFWRRSMSPISSSGSWRRGSRISRACRFS